MTRVLRAGAFVAAALAATAAAGTEARARPRIVYGGDARFAPYDSLDEHGVPTGFDVELMRVLAGDAGVDLEIRLGTWNEIRADFDAGRIDVLSLSYSEERALAYDWLAQTWWMHQCVLFRAGREAYPKNATELAGEIVAVQERSAVAEMLFRQAPPKPSLITVRTQDDALAMMERGVATGVGGNSLSLRTAAAARGIDALAEVPLRAVPYGYMAKKGRAAELRWIPSGLARLRESGTVEALAERFLAVPHPGPTRPDHTRWGLGILGVGIAVVVAAATAWRGRGRAVAERLRADAECQQTLDAVDVAVLILDGERRIRRLNRVARELVGGRESTGLEASLDGLPAVEPWRTATRLVEAASRAAGTLSSPAADPATRRTWEVTVFHAAGAAVEEARTIVAARDVTRLVDLRGALRQSETMSALGSLVAGVAHEIRNPLFSISATVDALEDEFGSRAEYAEFARPLRSQVARLTRLTRDLLDYGRSPALKPARIQVRDLLARAVDACADRARERGVHLLPEVDSELPWLVVDIERMEQVLENLIMNAVQHSPRGCTVRVGAHPSPDGETVELAVSDQGLGLADDDIPRLFEPFFSRREGGTGLGLSIVQRIVESHGGRVAAANQRGGGAVFTVALAPEPVCAARSATAMCL
jgi:signal transduction histidine kinase